MCHIVVRYSDHPFILFIHCVCVCVCVVTCRHEVNTVFAADAVARQTGIPGVAIVCGQHNT